MWFSSPSEVDGEVFDGVVKDKKQAEEEFRMAVIQGRTAGTVVQRYTHTHMDTPTVQKFPIACSSQWRDIEDTPTSVYHTAICPTAQYIIAHLWKSSLQCRLQCHFQFYRMLSGSIHDKNCCFTTYYE